MQENILNTCKKVYMLRLWLPLSLTKSQLLVRPLNLLLGREVT